jgi:hypothetical protein
MTGALAGKQPYGMNISRTKRCYQKRNAAGLCRSNHCTSSPVPGLTRCAPCAVAAEARCRASVQKNRAAAMVAYGGPTCKGCGETDYEVLTIDHEAQDGHKLRATQGSGNRLWRWLKRNNYPSGFRVLCWNCQHRAWMRLPLPNEIPLAQKACTRNSTVVL